MATNQMLYKTRGVEDIIGYSFNDPLILWEALQAAGSGIRSAGDRHFADGNKRLAMLGDAILKLVLVEDWYGSLDVRGISPFLSTTVAPASDTGPERASDIVGRVGSNANLNRLGRLHSLDEFICRNPSQAGYISQNTMASTVEAILGAVYLDRGIDHVSQVMQTLGLVPI